ncbi:MAG: hypothetical protein HY812_15045 [Planctomycetes bacterium]|nr:hypothetical protein [Planctomycetota bacterium]
MMDVAVATDSTAPGLDPDNALFLVELARRGLDARPVVWDDAAVDWSAFRLCVVRATWDYVLRRAEFLAWAERVAAVTRLGNDAPTLRWASHKSYLRDLDERGVHIVPTQFVDRGTPLSLAELMDARGWREAVVKPAVSASGRETFKAARGDLASAQERFERLVAAEDALVQAYMAGVTDSGEVSLVYIAGVYSHALRRRPAAGDFRVQGLYGGSIERVRPRTSELLVADRVLEAGPRGPLYARVDILEDGAGELRLNEYELVEPRLHFALCREAAARFADAVCGALRGTKEARVRAAAQEQA